MLDRSSLRRLVMTTAIGLAGAFAPSLAGAQRGGPAPARPSPQPAQPGQSAQPGQPLQLDLPPPPAPPEVTSAPLETPAGMPRVSFDDAVRRAVERNPSAIVAREEIRRSEALVRQARAGSLPTLSATAVYTRLDDDRRLADRIIAGANQLSANVTATVPLIAPQRWYQWRTAAAALDVTRASAEDVRRQLGVASARAYLAVLAQRRVVEVTRRARATADAHYQYAHTRFAGGVGNRLDELRAEQERATVDSQLAQAELGLARARESLGVLLGSDGPADITDEPALAAPTALADALAEADDRRTDVLAARARAAQAERILSQNWVDYMPLLVGTFQPFYQNPPSLVQPLTGWQAQLILTLPLYDGGLRYGLAAERRALAAQAHANVEAALRQAKADVRASFESVRKSDEALRAARDSARLTHQVLELALLAYRAGATTNIEVIDAERRARDADTAAEVAEDAARQARLDFLASSGRFPQ